jgi:hypothetical protein
MHFTRLEMLLDRLLIKLLGLALYDLEGAGRAFPQAGPKAIAVLLLDQAGLTVDDLDGPLGAGRGALSAPVA